MADEPSEPKVKDMTTMTVRKSTLAKLRGVKGLAGWACGTRIPYDIFLDVMTGWMEKALKEDPDKFHQWFQEYVVATPAAEAKKEEAKPEAPKEATPVA